MDVEIDPPALTTEEYQLMHAKTMTLDEAHVAPPEAEGPTPGPPAAAEVGANTQPDKGAKESDTPKPSVDGVPGECRPGEILDSLLPITPAEQRGPKTKGKGRGKGGRGKGRGKGK